MIIHDVEQGTESWKILRAKCFTASEAPNMMGAGFKKRADFLKEKALGTEEEFSDYVLALFAKGHATEALARPIAEEMFDLEFFPVVGTHDTDSNKLASLDGQSVCEKVLFEHKLWNENVVAQIEAKNLDPKYYWQLEHQLYVSGAEKVIFVCSDGTKENMVWMEYTPVRGRLKKLLAGWDLFQEDLNNFDYDSYEKPTPKIESVKQETLPVISFKMNGMELTSNVAAYTEAAKILVEKSQKRIETDQDFADQDALNKQLKKGEDYIKLMKIQVLSEVSSIEKFTADLDNLKSLMSKARLAGEKQVKTRKEELKAEVISNANKQYQDFIAKVNEGLGDFNIPYLPSDFPSQIKGLKTIESAKSNCNDHLSELKIAANEAADIIRSNVIAYQKDGQDYVSLFPDIHDIISGENFIMLMENRINSHKIEIDKKRIENEAKEAEVKAAIEGKINNLKMIPMSFLEKSAEEIGKKIVALDEFEIKEDQFFDKSDEARAAVQTVIEQLTKMLTSAKTVESAKYEPVDLEVSVNGDKCTPITEEDATLKINGGAFDESGKATGSYIGIKKEKLENAVDDEIKDYKEDLSCLIFYTNEIMEMEIPAMRTKKGDDLVEKIDITLNVLSTIIKSALDN